MDNSETSFFILKKYREFWSNIFENSPSSADEKWYYFSKLDNPIPFYECLIFQRFWPIWLILAKTHFLIKWNWVVQFWQIISFSRSSDRAESNKSVKNKTGQSSFLILAKIYSHDLKYHFKKGFSNEYFQKSYIAFWHGEFPTGSYKMAIILDWITVLTQFFSRNTLN